VVQKEGDKNATEGIQKEENKTAVAQKDENKTEGAVV